MVDIDVVLQDDTRSLQLYDNNVIEAKHAISLFVQYFVESDEVKKKLYQQINNFQW